MAARDKDKILIIKRRKKHAAHAHHGGAWKVAYADFVTAMMAFFLLLWLLNATTDEQKMGIADYFAPTVAPPGSNGSNGVLGGRTIQSEGAQTDVNSSVAVNLDPTTASRDEEDESEQETNDEAALERVAEIEEEHFQQAEHDLRQAIQDVPELQQLAENLIIDRTPEGMRIQIVDQANVSMFALGSSNMLDHTTRLMEQVAAVVGRLPNKISISGHTDAKPYSDQSGYTNWELSSDRANASRRALLDAGLPAERIASVSGKADQEPLAEDPYSPRNRRISITLLHETASRALAQSSSTSRS